MNLKIFFNEVRYSPFPGKLTAQQVVGCEYLIKEFARRNWTDDRMLAYILATAYHETAHTMQPIKEQGSRAYLESKRYYPWIGRGYVQLTWQANYQKFRQSVKALFNVDIIANPDTAMIPAVAAYIAFEGMQNGTFTGKSLSDYFNETQPPDYWYEARRIINGTDQATKIAGYARSFFVAITMAKEKD